MRRSKKTEIGKYSKPIRVFTFSSFRQKTGLDSGLPDKVWFPRSDHEYLGKISGRTNGLTVGQTACGLGKQLQF